MIDCPNGDVRDVLPEYVHDRLEPAQRADVERHLASCEACRDELELLRAVRSTLHRHAPRVNTELVAAAIPAYRAPVRRAWGGWRVAAAITAIAVGGTTITLATRGPARSEQPNRDSMTQAMGSRPLPRAAAPSTTESLAIASSAPSVRSTTAPVGPSPTPTGADAVSLSMTGQVLGDLSDRELATLLEEIDSLDGLPSEDVEGVGSISLERLQ